MATKSKGGNLVTSISDHFSQFSSLDIFPEKRKNALPKIGRSFKNFSDTSFSNELSKIDWPHILNGKSSDSKIETILAETTALLDKMVPFKKLKKEKLVLNKTPGLQLAY